METFYLCIVIFIFAIAVFDILVGVSNDAVNFLNSAIGAKAAPFKLVLTIAAIGVFIGASLSNGMMEIARHGIYQPQYFYFSEIICILLTVMLTDVVLLDTFNSFGLPTSTTVSMVFELLGATFALSLVKIYNNPELQFGELINTDKALSVIMGIFLSVAIAFFFGALVQYLTRLLFTFNYTKKMKYSIGIFGGIAATSILYFMLIKGLKDSSFMTPDNKLWIQQHTWAIIGYCFLLSTILMQVLHWLKVNIFKVIVLMGTLALALAFAGNDLVNFIGVPLAGYSAYIDFTSQTASVSPDGFLMESLLESAKTPWYFLFGSGVIMVYALFTSKKAHNVIKTSVNLSRQDEGEEMFGSSPIARTLVRISLNINNAVAKVMPEGLKNWVETRFRKDEAIMADGAAFDLVRAAVNLVLAGLLIAVGTSLKLPLSTTYVTFMVAMGTSLSDRAWGRDSAVFRITGVLSVIGGWFLTAGAAFTFAFFVALLIHYGGVIAILCMMAAAFFILIRSQVIFRKKKKEAVSETTTRLLNGDTSDDTLSLLRRHTREELEKVLAFTEESYEYTIAAFFEENLRRLRKSKGKIKFEKQMVKQMRRVGTIAISRLDSERLLDKGLYYYQGNDFASELVYSISRICEPALEYIDNNFNPLNESQKEEFNRISEQVITLLHSCRTELKENNYDHFKEDILQASELKSQLSALKQEELHRIQNHGYSIKASLIYLTLLQETHNVVSYTINLMKVSRKFQLENPTPSEQ